MSKVSGKEHQTRGDNQDRRFFVVFSIALSIMYNATRTERRYEQERRKHLPKNLANSLPNVSSHFPFSCVPLSVTQSFPSHSLTRTWKKEDKTGNPFIPIFSLPWIELHIDLYHSFYYTTDNGKFPRQAGAPFCDFFSFIHFLLEFCRQL